MSWDSGNVEAPRSPRQREEMPGWHLVPSPRAPVLLSGRCKKLHVGRQMHPYWGMPDKCMTAWMSQGKPGLGLGVA